jgi:hypothetical protein
MALTGDIRRILRETERTQILAALEETQWVVAGPDGPRLAWE